MYFSLLNTSKTCTHSYVPVKDPEIWTSLIWDFKGVTAQVKGCWKHLHVSSGNPLGTSLSSLGPKVEHTHTHTRTNTHSHTQMIIVPPENWANRSAITQVTISNLYHPCSQETWSLNIILEWYQLNSIQ